MTTLTHIQSTPSSTWTITHNLNSYVACDTRTYDGPALVKTLAANMTQTLNVLTVTWSSAQTGEVTYVPGGL
jgi:hypothetical protein